MGTIHDEAQRAISAAISPEEAWARLVPHLPPLHPRVRPIERRRAEALHCVLAEEILAPADFPALDVSAMDGFALDEAAKAGVALPVVATIRAGDPPGAALVAGHAARIMTGAPVPRGADRVVPVERSRVIPGDSASACEGVVLSSVLAPGANVRRRGEVTRRGDRLLSPGDRLGPSRLALLAANGIATVRILEPTVAILPTGDEVVPADSPPGRGPMPGQLRDSHTDFLRAAGAEMALAFVSLGIAPDRAEALGPLLERGLGHDVLIVCGGVSAGEFDLVEPELERLGCRLLFDAVAIQPGRPMVAAVHPGGLVFGLPGNPASAMVCFRLFVEPALRRLQGETAGFWDRAVAGRLLADLPGAGERDRFLPASVTLDAGGFLVTPHPPQGSHDLLAYARGPAIVRVRAGSAAARAGDACEVLLPLLELG